jgi:hypothetical protein
LILLTFCFFLYCEPPIIMFHRNTANQG